MDNIEMSEPSEEFASCWNAACDHLQSVANEVNLDWLKANLTPPFLEHLSFRIGNQLFFVRIRPEDCDIDLPGNETGYRTIAEQCKGVACLMPMSFQGNIWRPVHSGWGLVDPDTSEIVDPVNYVTDEKIELTDWELHDFAVQVVRDHIVDKLKFELMSSQGCPDVDPSIWFVGEHGPEWVVVRGVRYPELEASPPENIEEIANHCVGLGKTGHFASVFFASTEDEFDSSGKNPMMPIWRGYGALVRFRGLVPVGLH